jgi:hypothetical protein
MAMCFIHVLSLSINLLSQVQYEEREVRVRYQPTATNPSALVEQIELRGHKATIMDIQRSPIQKVTLDVGGMTCQSCVDKIENGVSHLDGVQKVNNIQNSYFLIQWLPYSCPVFLYKCRNVG